MSLTDFKEQFDNSYEEIFQKVLVAKSIMNTRFESVLKYGDSIQRIYFNIDNVVVRDVTRGSASTIDTITDTGETLTVNLEKEMVFFVSDGEITQAGPLNPGEIIGGQVAIKLGADLDRRCFAEVANALYRFDHGDLLTLVSTTVASPFELTSTTVPQLVTRMQAKLRYRNNITLTNMAFVVDSYAASDIEQYLLGKQYNIVDAVFKNGYSGTIGTAELYISENLYATCQLGSIGSVLDGNTVTINGVVLTAKGDGGTTAGYVAIGTNTSIFFRNLLGAISSPTVNQKDGTAYCYTAVSDASGLVNAGVIATQPTGANVINLSAGGRLTVSSTLVGCVPNHNTLHCYFGKKGAIDLVIQDLSNVDMRTTVDRRGTNIFSSYLAGLKTFTDGAKKFLDVQIGVGNQ